MEQVRALQGFDHSGMVKRGATTWVTSQTADKLERAGLVVRVSTPSDATRPPVAAGTPSSALPADPASPQTTAIASAAGETQTRARTRRPRTPKADAGTAAESLL